MSHQKSFYSHFILLYNHCSHWSWTNMCRRTMFLDQALPLIPGSKQFEKKLQAVWKLSINTFSYDSALCSTGREISFHPSWQIIKASTMKLKGKYEWNQERRSLDVDILSKSPMYFQNSLWIPTQSNLNIQG